MTESIKLSFLEWTNVVLVVVNELGADRVTGILQRAIGVDRANELIKNKRGPALSKEDNRAIVRELYNEPLTGKTRADKINWAIEIGRKAFDSDERFQEVLAFVLRRVQEDEDAGGTIDNAPPTHAPDLPDTSRPPAGATDQFLWKPQGEHTKKLVVLTPWSISVEPKGVMVVNGETGNYTGLHNGARGHHRFSKPGSAYGSNIRVEYTWRGRKYVWIVPNGGSRYTAGVPKPEGGTAPVPVPPVTPGQWKPAVSKIQAAMVTPLFVMKDSKVVRQQIAQLVASSNFNSVASLVDLQTGPSERQYIFNGRNATRLAPAAEANIKMVLDAGLTPIVMVRNDWASRTKKQYIPSVGGASTGASFYSADKLANEKKFLSSLKWLYPHAHIQLNLEPDRPEAANFALEMAKHLRAEGFKNKLIVNPYLAADAHRAIKSQLDAQGVVWARSKNSGTTSEDPIFNSDGNTSLNNGNAPQFIADVRKTGKEYIIWSRELANSQGALPAGYLGSSTPVPQPQPPSSGFAWLPDLTGTTVRIPYAHWQLHVFSRRKHDILYGPDKTGKSEYRIPVTGQGWREASQRAGDDGSVLVFVNTNTELTGKNKNAGWRIMDPTKSVTGDSTRLKPGEDK